METGRDTLSVKFYKATKHQVCPECGGVLQEVDRSEEGEATFVWYECGRDDCYGQWLQKIEQAV